MREPSARDKRFIKYTKGYLNLVQRRFIKEMGPIFGLLTITPFDLGFFHISRDAYIAADKREIILSTRHATYDCCTDCWRDWVRSRGFVLGHELGHDFHFQANPELVRQEKGKYTEERSGWSKEGHYLSEIVAELSTLIFHDKIGRLNNNLLGGICGYDYFPPSFQLFLDNRNNSEGLLRRLAKMDVKQASSIIQPYRHLQCSIKSSDVGFGMCVKVENVAA